MKPVVFLNKTLISGQSVCRLVLKNENRALKERLLNSTYLRHEASSGHYIMPLSDHNVRMLTDHLGDIALVNTTYLYRKAIKTVPVTVDKQQPTARHKHHYRPGITLRPLEHDHKLFLVLAYKFDHGLYNRLKSLPYVKYSKTYKKFVTHLDETHLRKLLHDLTPRYRINLDSNIQVNDIVLLKAFWEQSSLDGQYTGCPDAYLERLKLQGYSINTIRTYHSMLLRYLNHRDCPIEAINSHTELEVNAYHRAMAQSGHFSFSSINQSLNAIKYYFKEVLQRPLPRT